jgi:peptidyl-prolyl cis-trans isomerase C
MATITGCNKETPVEQAEVDLSKIDIFEQPAKPMPGAADPAQVVVSVNGQDVTLAAIMATAGPQLQMIAQQVPAEQLASVQQQVFKQAEETMVMEIILGDAAKAAGIEVGPSDVDAQVAQMEAMIAQRGGTLDQMLAQQGTTLEQFKADIAPQIAIQKMMEAAVGEIAPATDEEAMAFYDENKDRFTRPETVRASHILVKTEATDTDEVKAEKKAKAEALALEAQAEGADFAALAQANSDCPSSEQGGDLDFFEKERMVPEFSAAAYSMNVGDVSGVVETQFGYHVIKVTDKRAGEVAPFEDAAAFIKGQLLRQKTQEAMRAHAETLRAAAKVVYPNAPEAPAAN